ncbi:Protein kinase domain-containing protein ppk32 [Exophiala xenobiotica]|nr:Protein kinase domain-containing protein ppk32 [Exophiala xenobiotica]KAK5211303.1 Protein kinase domain-containing protein ppk32 [Exophiala xenobiotica]KAK5218689.1 Protein kinase domain-containing protein ppk32 [Exophiala xenobiotica]KAK5229081.1 Protein kinase domain-containing protein ppk32 [Exophiala xenobiotica]KAK5253001.1 Protein kinase domain-containing protein ppk32 [Exophiala xenobiotica]
MRDPDDAASRTFSLAGPAPLDALIANQPYVDPGYAQLNPAYDQPANVRPVWGLAGPLPHVLRPGMVPAKDEFEKEAVAERQAPPPTDIEAGRIEPSLRPDKVSSQLDTIRRERELSLYRAYQSRFQESPSLSPFRAGRRASDAPTETPNVRVHTQETILEEPPSDLEEFPQLSEAIAGVKQAREEREEQEEFKAPYQDVVPLPAYQAEDDEVHNLHTYWSVVRLRFREPLAELLAIMVQYTLGFSANLALTVSRGTAGVGDTADWAWGLATMIAIYIAGGISGAHLNPAISLMLYIYRGFPLQKVPIYIAAQMLGAFLAALIAFGIFKPGLVALLHEQHQKELLIQSPQMDPSPSSLLLTLSPTVVLSNFITFPRTPWVDTSTAFLTELTGTAILVISVLALGDNSNAPPGAGMNAFIVGLLVTVLGMAFGYNTGLAMNPVRDFGPRVAMWVLGYSPKILFADGYWFKVAWLGPLIGAIIGGLLYDAAIFVGGESPVNYPTRRIRRAARKWRKRWRARMRRTKGKVRGISVLGSGNRGYETVEG